MGRPPPARGPQGRRGHHWPRAEPYGRGLPQQTRCDCSVLIVLSRVLVVQGEEGFLALGVSGCFWGNEACIVKYKVKWRTKASPEGLLYTRGGR
jgi:hypothetical protein